MKFEHGPISNGFFIVSILGMIFTYSIWQLSEAWGFLIAFVSIIIFIASFISATRAPLDSDEEIELAIHEKYRGRRYPDTDIDAHVKEKEFRTLVRKQAAEKKKTAKKSTKKKTAKKKSAKKKTTKKKTVKKTKK